VKGGHVLVKLEDSKIAFEFDTDAAGEIQGDPDAESNELVE
jgi:hypothetical protein